MTVEPSCLGDLVPHKGEILPLVEPQSCSATTDGRETNDALVKELMIRLTALSHSHAQFVALRDFLEAPAELSIQNISSRLRYARKACEDAIMSIKTYSFRNIAKLETALAYAGDLQAAFLYQERIIDERLALVQSEFFANFKLPVYEDPLALFAECRPEVAVRDLHRAIEAVEKSELHVKGEIRTLENGNKAFAFLDRLCATRSSLSLVRHHMECFAADLKQEGLTTEEVIKLTRHYIGQECARTYFANSWKPFEEMYTALQEFSGALKSQPVMGL